MDFLVGGTAGDEYSPAVPFFGRLLGMIQPTWETDDGVIRLYCADCLDVLPTLEAGSVGAVVTDPPYGVSNDCSYNARGLGYSREKNWPARDWPQVEGDNEPFDPRPFLAWGVPTVLWGANYFSDKLPPSGWFVWDKERPDQLDQSTCEVAWVSSKKNIRRFRHLWNGLCRATEIGEHFHPTQKPVALMEWCLSFFDVRGAVLDPYMGSGPVGVACARHGLEYIGIECHGPYFETAKNRIIAELSRTPLFPDEPLPSQKNFLTT